MDDDLKTGIIFVVGTVILINGILGSIYFWFEVLGK